MDGPVSSSAFIVGPGMGLVVHSDQVAGHGDLLKNEAKGQVYKRAVDMETKFYVQLNGFHPHPLAHFIPRFYGLVRIPARAAASGDQPRPASSPGGSRAGPDADYLLLEDLVHGMEHPSVMDVKIGRCSYLPDFTEEKKMLCAAKDKMSTTTQLGIRVTGFKTWQARGAYLYRGKEWGKQLSIKMVPDAIKAFFDDGQSLRTDALQTAITQLEAIEATLERHMQGWKFVSSSILIVYGECQGRPCADARMIDFAHTLPPEDLRIKVEEVDYLYGLRNLLSILKVIRASPEHQSHYPSLDYDDSAKPLG